MQKINDKADILKQEVSIAFLWNHLGLSGKPSRLCRSPFREDKHPSFSVWRAVEGFDLWKDHTTGESGTIIQFFAKLKGVSNGVAIAELLKLRNISSPPSAPKPSKESKPEFRKPTSEECRALGKLRGLDPAAFDLAASLGTLRVGQHPATKELLWWLTDVSGHACEGRTFTGQACQCSGKKVSALPGSKKDIPVGLKTTNPDYDKLPRLLMVEGSSDYFAGIHMAMLVAMNFRVCSMLGACCNISDAALPFFNDKKVLIMAHNDDAGQLAAYRWKDQISRAKDAYVTIQPLPAGVKDLNDLLLTPLFSITQ